MRPLSQWRLAVERAGYEAERAERQYRAVEPKCHLDRNVAPERSHSQIQVCELLGRHITAAL